STCLLDASSVGAVDYISAMTNGSYDYGAEKYILRHPGGGTKRALVFDSQAVREPQYDWTMLVGGSIGWNAALEVFTARDIQWWADGKIYEYSKNPVETEKWFRY